MRLQDKPALSEGHILYLVCGIRTPYPAGLRFTCASGRDVLRHVLVVPALRWPLTNEVVLLLVSQ